MMRWRCSIANKTWHFADHAAAGPSSNLAHLLRECLSKYEPPTGVLGPGYHFLYANQPNTSLGTDWYDNYQAPTDNGTQLYKRRMWVAGQIKFVRPIALGEPINCTETISGVRELGTNVFVTTKRDFGALVETRTLMYTNEPFKVKKSSPGGPFSHEVQLIVSPQQIARYCALTYNVHRIHHDLGYCREEECLPGILVPGPMMVTLALGVFHHTTGLSIESIKYKNSLPVLANQPLTIGWTDGASPKLNVVTDQGTAMVASLVAER